MYNFSFKTFNFKIGLTVHCPLLFFHCTMDFATLDFVQRLTLQLKFTAIFTTFHSSKGKPNYFKDVNVYFYAIVIRYTFRFNSTHETLCIADDAVNSIVRRATVMLLLSHFEFILFWNLLARSCRRSRCRRRKVKRHKKTPIIAKRRSIDKFEFNCD